MAYAVAAMRRAESLGAKVVVFGSGPSKQVPPGFAIDAARAQLIELLQALSPVARELGLTIAIEPLRRQECNIVNSAAEGLALVRSVASEEVKLLVDFYHLDAEKENPTIVREAGAEIRHIHIARPEGRAFPAPADAPLFADFFAALAAIAYDGRVSIEAYSGHLSRDAAVGLSFLRGLHGAV